MGFLPGFRNVLAGAFPSAGAALTYLLRDDFITAASAPLTSPRTCEPGPGTFTITDSGNYLSITGGELVGTNRITAYVEPRAVGGAITRAAGLCFRNDQGGVSNNSPTTGLAKASNPTLVSNLEYYFLRTNATTPTFRANGGSESTTLAAIGFTYGSGMYPTYFILRSTGVFLVVYDGTNYRLLWVHSTQNTATLYPFLGCPFSGSSTTKIDNARVAQLGDPWNSDNGIATGFTASPSSGASLTTEVDCLVEATWTASTGVTAELDVRRTDANNRWIVRCDQAGGTIKLIERNAGVETERASAAQTWTNGTAYRIVAICRGNTIATFVAGTSKNTYASATFNNTATGAMITASAGTLANFAAWPGTLSGTALSTLQAI